jgi:hypothetical protein
LNLRILSPLCNNNDKSRYYNKSINCKEWREKRCRTY